MSIGIYIIENLVNNKKYIGQSVNLEGRKNNHFYKLRHGTHINEHLQRAWDKYGEKNFRYYVACYCEEDELDDLERMYIQKLSTTADDNGYNQDAGGNKNKRLSEKLKKKHREIKLGTNSKLTVEQVGEIKELLTTGITQKELGEMYNVGGDTINKIAKCKNWDWVKPELNEIIFKKFEEKKNEKKIKAKELIKEGYSDREIGKRLNMCKRTIANLREKPCYEALAERNEKIVKDFNEGMSKQEIMDKYSITSAVYVSVTHEAYNIKLEKQKEEVIKLREEGMKVGDIALLYNMHRTTVTEWTKHLSKRRTRNVNTEVS